MTEAKIALPEGRKIERSSELNEPRVHVGTWQQLQAHAAEFGDRILRVTVLSNDIPNVPEVGSASELFAKMAGRHDFGVSDVAARSEEVFGEIMEEKYPRHKP